MKAAYLVTLIISIVGLAILDRRYKFMLWGKNNRSAIVTLVVGVFSFLIWDLMGIALHIFYPGDSRFVLGTLVTKGLPLEELVFLVLLCYVSLMIWRRAKL